MSGTEIRDFGHLGILTKIAYSNLIRNLENLTNFEVCLHSL